MGNRLSATVVALAICACSSTQSHGQSQAKDSTPTFSLFGGRVLGDAPLGTNGLLSNVEFGGSADFRVRALPVPLRATLAFREESRSWEISPMKYGTLSLEAVGKPLPRIFRVQPYLLGGLGLATRAEFVRATYQVGADGQYTYTGVRTIPRSWWAFADVGVGLELGRHLFVQSKIMVPVASQGPTFVPLSVGFRFWD